MLHNNASRLHLNINTYLSFCWTYGNSADLDQRPQYVAFDRGLPCLLPERSITNSNEKYNPTTEMIQLIREENSNRLQWVNTIDILAHLVILLQCFHSTLTCT